MTVQRGGNISLTAMAGGVGKRGKTVKIRLVENGKMPTVLKLKSP